VSNLGYVFGTNIWKAENEQIFEYFQLRPLPEVWSNRKTKIIKNKIYVKNKILKDEQKSNRNETKTKLIKIICVTFKE
jgi:hypothetical protein